MDLIENDASNSSSIVEYIFIAMGMCLLRFCLTTGLLLSNNMGDIHRYTGEVGYQQEGLSEVVFSVVQPEVIQRGQLSACDHG